MRQRVGTTVPLTDTHGGWALTGDAELFVTLRNSEPGRQTGSTGRWTFADFGSGFGRYDISLRYLRQQHIRTGPRTGAVMSFVGRTVNV